VGEIAVDNAVYRLSISLSSPEIFVVKVKSYHKRTKFWTFFALPNFKGAVPPKTCTQFIMPGQHHVKCQSFFGLHPLT